MGERRWDPRLITPERVLGLVGDVVVALVEREQRITAEVIDADQVIETVGPAPALVCQDCTRAGRPDIITGPVVGTVLDVMSRVLAHRCMVHQEVLSGGTAGRTAGDGSGPRGAGPAAPGAAGGGGGHRPDDHRPSDQG